MTAHSKSGRGGTVNYRSSAGGGGTTLSARGRGERKGGVDCTDPAAYRSFVNATMHTNGMRNRQVRMLAGARMDYVGPDGEYQAITRLIRTVAAASTVTTHLDHHAPPS